MASKKVILITGASSGLGEAMAEYLSESGHIVYGVSRSIRPKGKFQILTMDITNKDSVRNTIEKIIEERGRIDVLINNAGLRSAGPLEYISEEELRLIFETNVHGTLKLCQAVLPIMRQQNSGLIINISSLSSENGWPFQSSYCASKAALDRLTESLSAELAQTNIKICCVQPGNVKTRINDNIVISTQPINSLYQHFWKKCYSVIQADTEKGISTSRLNRLVDRIISSNRIKIRYKIGALLDLSSIVGKRILPERLYQKIINAHFGI